MKPGGLDALALTHFAPDPLSSPKTVKQRFRDSRFRQTARGFGIILTRIALRSFGSSLTLGHTVLRTSELRASKTKLLETQLARNVFLEQLSRHRILEHYVDWFA